MQEKQKADTTKGYYHWRNLPHYDFNNQYQMITYRLNDSLPREVIEKMAIENENDAEKRAIIEKYLDAGYGSCILVKYPQIADMLIENWKYFDKQKYDLVAFVVMPNHVHILIKIYRGIELGSILHSWKSYTSKKFKILSGLASVPGWQIEYWDRYIRDENHFKKAIEYIHKNPVKAGLCQKPEDWPYSSCSERKEVGSGSVGGPPITHK